jgi:hypothetical protein
MTLKAGSMATLADENSRKRPVRRAKKSKLLKFSVDPRSDFEMDTEGESDLIPEPEPEKINFFQAYPEIDFSAGPEKKRRGRKINEFAYIYGSGGFFEPEDPDEDDYPEPEWSPEPEIEPEPQTGSGTMDGVKTGAEYEIESKIKSGYGLELKSSSGLKYVPERAFEPELSIEPEAGLEPDPGFKSEMKSEIKSEVESEVESEIKPEIKPEIKLKIKPESESESRSGSDPQGEPEPNSGSGLEAISSGVLEPHIPENMKDVDEKLPGKGNSLEALVPPYKICLSSGLPQSGDLSEVSDEQLEEAVVSIVECEGPIHSEEIFQRIKSHTGISRMFGKIKQRILDSMASAESSGKILARGEFYWPLSEPAYLLRRRDTDAYAKIECICDEEIKEAVRFVLNNQYSTPMEDLIIQTSRVLGIKTTRKNTWDKIEKLIQSGIESNELTRTPNEMIYFVEQK